MSYDTIDLTVENGLARLVLNQPEAGNPFNARFCEEFGQVGNALGARSDIRAILLTARGKFFGYSKSVVGNAPASSEVTTSVNGRN